MGLPKVIDAQRDFSAGELNADAKRRDDTRIASAGARQALNWRILNSGALQNRSGRRALYDTSGRVEKVLVAPNTVFDLCFDNDGHLRIRNPDGTIVLDTGGFPWNISTFSDIVIASAARGALERQIIICFPGMRPAIARWVSGLGWQLDIFQFGTGSNGILAPFYRLAPPGRQMTVTGSSGHMNVVLDLPYFTPSMVGMRMRWLESQIVLTDYISPVRMGADVVQALPPTFSFTVTNAQGEFALGEIFSNVDGIQCEIAGVNLPTTITVNMLRPGTKYTSETIIGPRGRFTITAEALVNTGAASFKWDEEVMSNIRGWPQSCFFDQGRLGFCDIPAVPSGIAWSRIGAFDDFLVGAEAGDPIFELNSDGSRVYHVINKGDEFVFTDRGVYFIPISETNPLKPGSVAFNKIAVDSAARVKPTQTAEGVLFLNAGRNRVIAIIPRLTTTAVPYELRESSLYHSHLFRSPIALAATTGDGTFAERYVFVLNSDGTLAVGRYESGQEWVGWLPWNGAGLVKWVTALGADITFVTAYGSTFLCELLDDTCYLDGATFVNVPPVSLTPPPGFGSQYFRPGTAVDLMDGVRPIGTRTVDALGNIIPQPGEDLSSPTLMAGNAWAPILTLDLPAPPPGNSNGQRMKRRAISRIAVSVAQSTGYVINNTRVPPWRIGENMAAAPPLREETMRFRLLGRDYEPMITLTKDVPGPLQVLEIATEMTV